MATSALVVGVLTAGDDAAVRAAQRSAWQQEEARYVASLESRSASIPDAGRAAFAHEAEQYVDSLEARAASISDDDPSTEGFVPETRHVPLR